MTLDGLSPDEPTVYNENGAGQSHLPYRFDLIDPDAIFAMARVLSEGATKYGADNWKGIPTRDHLNHLIVHAYAALSGDTQDDHYSHMMCRAMFAHFTHTNDEIETAQSLTYDPATETYTLEPYGITLPEEWIDRARADGIQWQKENIVMVNDAIALPGMTPDCVCNPRKAFHEPHCPYIKSVRSHSG